MLLSVDTSTRYGGCCLNDGQQTIASLTWFSSKNHSEELIPAISKLLNMATSSHIDITGIAVAIGPGRFSALRVGLSVVKGITLHRHIPVVGVGTLELEAYEHLSSNLPVCAIIESGRTDYIAAIFRGISPDITKVLDETIVTESQLMEIIKEPTILCGEGTKRLSDEIRQNVSGCFMLVNDSDPASRLTALSNIGNERLSAGLYRSSDDLEPLYVRRPSIGVANPQKKLNFKE